MKEILETLFLVAGIQGILLSVLLFTRKNNHNANAVLAICVLTLSFYLFNALYYSKGIFLRYPHFIGIFYPLPYFYGPLFYIYAKLITKKEMKFSGQDLYHFLPAAVIYLISLPVILSGGPEKIEFVNNMSLGREPWIFKAIGYLVPVPGVVYTFLTVKAVLDYGRKIKDNFSNIDKINLNWLKYIALSAVIIWSMAAFFDLFKIIVMQIQASDVILSFLIALLIYSIGYIGLQQPEIFMPPEAKPLRHSEKYNKSGLTDDSAEELKKKLLNIMTEKKPYLDCELTLSKLSELSGISGHHLSEVLNSRLNKTYFDFINSYRIEEFKNRLQDPANSNLSMLGIAFDSGFNSKTTFNKIFKKFTKMTPSEFKYGFDNLGLKT